MRYLNLIALSTVFILAGCSLKKPETTVIDQNLPAIGSIKTLADAGSLGLEWIPSDDSRVTGYKIYRNGPDGFLKVGTLYNRYASHFVDNDVAVQTTYNYKVSTITADGRESQPTNVTVATLPPPEPLSYVEVIKGLQKQVKLIWRPHPNPATEGYKILRADPRDNNKWVMIGYVKGRPSAEFIDTDLEDGRIYQYRIVARMFNGIESLPTAIVEGSTQQPLPYPDGIKTTSDLPKSIKISWNTVPNSAYYNVYSSRFETVSFEKTKVRDTNFTQLIDEDGASRYYKISSVAPDGYEGNLSPIAIQGSTLSKPATPKLVSNFLENGQAVIRWLAGDSRPASYKIIRRVYNGPLKTKLVWDERTFTDINATQFNDASLIPGNRYGYFIYAVDKYGIVSEPSQEAEVSTPIERGQ